MNQDAKRNLDQIGGGHLVRDTDRQFEGLLNGEESRLAQYLNSASDKQILDTLRRGLFADRFRNGNLINSSINSAEFVDPISRPYNPDLSAGQLSDQLFMNQFRDAPSNAQEGDRRIVRNLDQIGGGHLVRNLDQIGGGHLVRNLNQLGNEQLIRNLDQIGGGHLVRDLHQIGDGKIWLDGDLVRSIDYPNAETKRRRIDQPTSISEKLHFTRNLDQIGGGNLVRNLDQIGGGNLVRNLDQIGGGNLVRSLN